MKNIDERINRLNELNKMLKETKDETRKTLLTALIKEAFQETEEIEEASEYDVKRDKFISTIIERLENTNNKLVNVKAEPVTVPIKNYRNVDKHWGPAVQSLDLTFNGKTEKYYSWTDIRSYENRDSMKEFNVRIYVSLRDDGKTDFLNISRTYEVGFSPDSELTRNISKDNHKWELVGKEIRIERDDFSSIELVFRRYK